MAYYVIINRENNCFYEVITMSKNNSTKDTMRFPSIDSLMPVQNVLKEASEALSDKTRTINDSPISDVLGGAVGAGVGGATSFAALYFGGSVVGLSAAGITSGLAAAGSIIGGGMVAGIGVLAAPAVILAAIGVELSAHKRDEQLKEAKEICYTEALRMQNAIIKNLQDEQKMNKDRIEYLHSINILLRKVIEDLEYDLGYKNV